MLSPQINFLYRQDLIRSENTSLLYPSHKVYQPFRAFNPFIKRFYTQRSQQASQTPTPQQEMLFKKSRIYFIPGFLNHSPHPDFLRKLSQSAEHGLGFVSVSEEAHYFDNKGYTVIGGKTKVYQPDWRKELATVVKRIYVDLKEQEARAAHPERLILIGHSKGGLLIHSLAAFHKAEKFSERERLLSQFPGMSDVPDEVVTTVLASLEGAYYLGIGTPFDGLDKRTIKIAKQYGFEQMFGDTIDYYKTEFLERLYEQIGLQPDDPDQGIHAVMTAQPFQEDSPAWKNFFKRAWTRMKPNWSSLFYHGGHTFFDLGALLLGSNCNHDALVAPSKKNFPASLHLKGQNHVTMIGAESADTVIQFIQDTIPKKKEKKCQNQSTAPI